MYFDTDNIPESIQKLSAYCSICYEWADKSVVFFGPLLGHDFEHNPYSGKSFTPKRVCSDCLKLSLSIDRKDLALITGCYGCGKDIYALKSKYACFVYIGGVRTFFCLECADKKFCEFVLGDAKENDDHY